LLLKKIFVTSLYPYQFVSSLLHINSAGLPILGSQNRNVEDSNMYQFSKGPFFFSFFHFRGGITMLREAD
jgi:hypothetical protein